MFTAFQAICGALLIQFATNAFFRETGRTVGFSSIAYSLVSGPGLYSIAIVLGLSLATVAVHTYLPQFLPPESSASSYFVSLCGFLVGWGTSWGSGCTSGHMLCGVSLLRLRSIAATLIFSSVAIAVVNIWDLAPSCGAQPCYSLPLYTSDEEYWQVGLTAVAGFFLSKLPLGRVLAGVKCGFLFGLGLYFSGMANPAKPLGFLSIFHKEKFDPSLGMIVLFAIIPNMVEWQILLHSDSKPYFEDQFALPTAKGFPKKFLLGAAIFGVGWGLMGVCPGPGMLAAPLSLNGATWMASFFAGYAMSRHVG